MADKTFETGFGAERIKDLGDGSSARAVVAAACPVSMLSATILNGASESNTVDLGVNRLSAIIMPSSWTAAGLSFLVSVDGSNFFNLRSGSGDNEVTWSVSASGYYPNESFMAWKDIRYFKVRSGTAASPINQGGARVLTIVAAP